MESGHKSLSYDAAIFDLDGVITKTALVHAVAWREMFNEYLQLRARRDGEPFKEFTYKEDYLPYIDGKPRYKGVQSFLESRGINIPFGEKGAAADEESVCGLGNKKNIKFREVLKKEGVNSYKAAVNLIRELKDKGVKIGVASSSKNCQFVLKSAGIEDLFETRVDGVVSVELGLKGKPQGDIFIQAVNNLGSDPSKAIVFEDAVSGVQAGRNGGFNLVVGIAREENEEELKKNGADIVIKSFEGVTADVLEQWFNESKIL
ncbi:MAG: beta-phosphoglucomutase family hydrolase [Candidatus Omnitrophica bacterium]|nr:beta-phosphoglucomutase family hydrolase [Candidatus Omnitrophota bacterium]MBU4333533.1 beta-phosphoglucomutase family hydrolase [Candidatus Omnitrophota bacterium]